MPIVRPTKFTSDTTASNLLKRATSGRGLLLQSIDHALEEYWGAVDSGAPQQEIKEKLYGLIKACHHWSKAKSTKTNPSKLGMKRKLTVMSLSAASTTALKLLSPAYRYFEQQKRTFGKKGNLTALHSGYHHERREYLQSGKASDPTSASAARDAVAPNMHAVLSQSQMQRLGTVLNKSLETWTDADFNLVANEMKVDPSYSDATRTVSFMNKLRRLDYLVIPTPLPIGMIAAPDRIAPLISAESGQTYDNNDVYNNAPVPEMYAMDFYGNLFVKDASSLQGGGYFNHSSFNSGNPVVSAGMILIRNGELHHIDNDSGHYKPDGNALWSAVRFLHRQNVDLSNARVTMKTPTFTRQFTGPHFLQHGPTAAPNWLPPMTAQHDLF